MAPEAFLDGKDVFLLIPTGLHVTDRMFFQSHSNFFYEMKCPFQMLTISCFPDRHVENISDRNMKHSTWCVGLVSILSPNMLNIFSFLT